MDVSKMLIPKCRRLNFLEPWKVVSALVLFNAPSEIGRLFFSAASPWTQPSSNICTRLFEDLSSTLVMIKHFVWGPLCWSSSMLIMIKHCLRTALMIMFNAYHDQTLFEDLSDDQVAHPFQGHTRAHLSQLGLAFSWPSFNPWLYSKFS